MFSARDMQSQWLFTKISQIPALLLLVLCFVLASQCAEEIWWEKAAEILTMALNISGHQVSKFPLYIKHEFCEFKWWISKYIQSETITCLIFSNIFNPKFGGGMGEEY